MNYATIKKNDIANGTGVRVSLFVSGCRHRCKGCFNRDAWSFSYGSLFTDEVAGEVLDAADHSYIEGLSLLGGEPFEPENQEPLIDLVRQFKQRFPQKTVWCYSGFTFEEIVEGKAGDPAVAMKLLRQIDVLVDGKFEEELKDLSLIFRGSSNQRIIDVKASLDAGEVCLLAGDWQRKYK